MLDRRSADRPPGEKPKPFYGRGAQRSATYARTTPADWVRTYIADTSSTRQASASIIRKGQTSGADAGPVNSSAAMVSVAYDLFEKLLAAQLQVVDELVSTQRQLAQRYVDTTATSVNKLTPR